MPRTVPPRGAVRRGAVGRLRAAAQRTSLRMLDRHGTVIGLAGGGALGVFGAGTAYGQITEGYKQRITMLEEHLEHQTQVAELRDKHISEFVTYEQTVRKKEDEILLRRLDYEREHVATSLAQVRESFGVQLANARYENIRFLFDAAFHGDYEAFREKVPSSEPQELLDALLREEVRRVAEQSAHELGREHSSKTMHVRVRNTKQGIDEMFDLRREETVNDLKRKLEDRTLLVPAFMRFFFRGVHLDDENPFKLYKSISDGATVYLEYDPIRRDPSEEYKPASRPTPTFER